MKVLSCTLIVLATLALSTCSSSSTTRHVLKFGSTVQDYVMFMPNMGYFTSQFSVCSWVKKLKTDGDPYWFHYATTYSGAEISITDDGYSRIFSGWPPIDRRNRLDITLGTWYHYCMCWSYSSTTFDVYYNGRKIGSRTTYSGRRLDTGGVLVLGQFQYPYGRIHTRRGDYCTFGGELFKLNMFSKKLTAAEVEFMYQAGICSEAEKIHGSYRQLTWERILQQTRHGNVQLVNVNIAELCPLQGNIEQKLNQTQFELNQTQTEFKSTKADLEQRLNQTQTELKSTKADLEQRLNLTQTEFKSTKADLLTCSSSSSTKQVLKFGNTLQDYVMFRPYMWAFTSQFSLCSWVRKIKTYNHPYWFHYATKSSFAEIRISDDHDGYDRIFTGPYLRKRNQPDIAPGTWYHYCMCWSYSSRTADVYYDGVKVGSFTTDSGRRLQKGGVLVLGQRNYPYGRIWADNPINSYSFGGELFKLNMFSKKFTAAEVKSMYQAGICSEAEKIHGSHRRLTWESILQQTRHGNVQLVNVDFAELSPLQGNIDSVENQLIEAKGELETVEEQLNALNINETEISETVEEQLNALNRNETEISEMRQRAALLEEKLNQTQTALQTAETVLKNTKNNLEQRLYRTQFELNQTRTEFKSTKADLEQRLNQTRIELKSTKADLEQRLNQTQVELKQSQAESEMYKSRISETEIFSANMSRELENTKTEFNLTKTQLRITKTELNLTKEDVEQIETNLLETRRNLETSLNETRADLKQVLDEQNRNKERQEKTNQDLDMLRVQLEKTKNRLNQTLAGLEEQLSDIPDCEVAAANISRELAATKLELDRKEEELERLKGAMSGEDCLRETSCSHWDILYNHCYFNNVLTEEKFMSLNKVWEKLGKK